MDKEEFYRKVDAILGVDTYTEQLPYKRRWGQRNPGNGRYPGFGVVRFNGVEHIHIMASNGGVATVANFADSESALEFIRERKNRTMKKYLVKFDKNWADEFDVYGMKVMDESQKAAWNETIAEHGSSTFSHWFGTNEGWGEDYEDEPIEDAASNYTFIEISNDEFEFLKKVWGSDEFGIFPDITDMVEEDDGDA